MTDLLRAESADGDVVARAALGEERAVAQLYDRYALVVYAVACRIVAEHADAEEVVAETFASVTFNAGAAGEALIADFALPPGGTISAAAVTEEPAGGSAQPTTPIILVAPLPAS